LKPSDARGCLAGCVLVILIAFGAPSALLAKPATAGAELQGAQVISWGRVEVAASPELAFEVLTDYEHMADFLPGMLASEVVSRKEHSVVIDQRADEGLLFFRQRVEVRLAIDESPPRRLTIRALAGSFKSLSGTYELTRMDDSTLIEYRARFVPDFRLPPMIGLYAVERSLQRHLSALADEMERRAEGDGTAQPGLPARPGGNR
jgi:ribosome-associated toxin RatA of RatAB toxin-antitoxin module